MNMGRYRSPVPREVEAQKGGIRSRRDGLLGRSAEDMTLDPNQRAAPMTKTVEILLYTLQPGTGDEFHKIMQDASVPLHQSIGMDVVAYGRSLHDPDAYHLIRAYDDLHHLETSQGAFYKSDAWRNGPRTDIIARIATSLKSVMPMTAEAVEALRQSGI